MDRTRENMVSPTMLTFHGRPRTLPSYFSPPIDGLPTICRPKILVFETVCQNPNFYAQFSRGANLRNDFNLAWLDL